MTTDILGSEIINRVAGYIAQSTTTDLPDAVVQRCKLHLLDTIAAMVSGSQLRPGRAAIQFVKSQSGNPDAMVIGTPLMTTVINAAMANAMMAHANETDDAHHGSHSHPGCAAVPAALAIAEQNNSDGLSLIKGIITGYDIGCRITKAIGVAHLNRHSRSTHSIAGNFAAAAAAAAVAGMDSEAIKNVMSYTAQQTSGVKCWAKDVEHIEKAFVFGGMPARNGVTAVVFAQNSFSGVSDPFSGKNNFFNAFSTEPVPEELVKGLGETYEIMNASLKQFPVGAPIQAPLEALFRIMRTNNLQAFDIEEVTVRLPDYGLKIVNDRAMPDVNLQYILAVAILERELTFEAAHSHERMQDRSVLDIKKRIRAVADGELSRAAIMRQGITEVSTRDGRYFKEHVVNWRGKAENPMNPEEVEQKAASLMAPVLGQSRTNQAITFIRELDRLPKIREIRSLLALPE